MRRLVPILFALALAGCETGGGGGVAIPPVNTNGPLYVQASPDPQLEAGIWAANYCAPGTWEVCQIGKTGSMLPTLRGGEWAVLVHDFAGIAQGKIVAYRTVGGSAPPIGSRLIHRIVDRTDAGWIPKGDTEGLVAEDWNPIGPENYIGTLVAIFRSQ